MTIDRDPEQRHTDQDAEDTIGIADGGAARFLADIAAE